MQKRAQTKVGTHSALRLALANFSSFPLHFPAWPAFLAGALAPPAGTLLLQPFDVAKTRLINSADKQLRMTTVFRSFFLVPAPTQLSVKQPVEPSFPPALSGRSNVRLPPLPPNNGS